MAAGLVILPVTRPPSHTAGKESERGAPRIRGRAGSQRSRMPGTAGLLSRRQIRASGREPRPSQGGGAPRRFPGSGAAAGAGRRWPEPAGPGVGSLGRSGAGAARSARPPRPLSPLHPLRPRPRPTLPTPRVPPPPRPQPTLRPHPPSALHPPSLNTPHPRLRSTPRGSGLLLPAPRPRCAHACPAQLSALTPPLAQLLTPLPPPLVRGYQSPPMPLWPQPERRWRGEMTPSGPAAEHASARGGRVSPGRRGEGEEEPARG